MVGVIGFLVQSSHTFLVKEQLIGIPNALTSEAKGIFNVESLKYFQSKTI